MPRNLITTIFAATLLLLSTACSPEGSVEGTYKRPKVWPKPVEPPPASPIYHDVDEKVPTEEEIERDAVERPARLAAAIEAALADGNALDRETVFVYFVPELLQVEPRRLFDLHARLPSGPARNSLGVEIAQQLAASDPPAAARWMKTLQDDERRVAAVAAVTTLAPWDPGAARSLAGELQVDTLADIRKLLSPR